MIDTEAPTIISPSNIKLGGHPYHQRSCPYHLPVDTLVCHSDYGWDFTSRTHVFLADILIDNRNTEVTEFAPVLLQLSRQLCCEQ